MNVADQDYCIGRGLAAILAKPELADNGFLRAAVEHNVSFLHRRSQGSTFLAISSGDLHSLPVPGLALSHQQRIAEILRTVDEAIEHTEALIAKTQQIKAGLMHDLFTRGVTADGKLRPPREEAPLLYARKGPFWVPRTWEVEPLGAYTSGWAMGPRFSGDLYAANGNVATLRTTDMDREGRISYGTMPFANLDVSRFRNHVLCPGDFVISRSGTCGIGGVFEGFDAPVLPGAFLIRFRLTDRLSAFYLRAYVNSSIGAPWVARIAEGGVQKNLRGTELASMLVPVPGQSEQQRITDRLESAEQLLQEESSTSRNLRAVRRGLMDDLLSGRVFVSAAGAAP